MIQTLADIEALERIPLDQRLDAATVPALLRRGARIDPSKTALEFLPSGRLDAQPLTLTHGQLLARIAQAAQLFRSLGVRRGDTIALLSPNWPQAYVALFGAMTAGIALPVNPALRAPQLQSLLATGKPKVIVADAALVDGLPPELLQGAALLAIGEPRDRWQSFEAACAAQPDEPLEDPSPADVAAFIHTGGTTGQPKLAKILHRAIAYKCWAYRQLLQQRPEHVALGVSPLFHVGGIVLRTLHPLSCGMTLVVPGALGLRDRDVLARYWRIVEGKRITDMSAVPTSLGVLAQADPGDADLSSLRPFAITGSSTLPLATARRFTERTGVRLLCDYGLTEYTATAAMPPPDAALPEGSAGLRLPYTQLRIARMEGGAGGIGEIQVKGPGAIAGYLDDAATAALSTADGWLRTGDLGRVDANGFLFVTGRAKDLIIRGGHNIDPRVIEETLQQHEDVVLAAAVGRPDAYAGELPVAYVQLRPGAKADAATLQAYAKERITERAAAPVAVHLLAELPLTAAGKVDKPLLRETSAREAIASVVREVAGVTRPPQVEVASDPLHGTVYRVTVAAGAETAALVAQSLSALACRCEVVAGPTTEVP